MMLVLSITFLVIQTIVASDDICGNGDGDDVIEYIPYNKCRQYYYCFNGEALSFQCSENLLFNSETNFCDLAENVKCDIRTLYEDDAGNEDDIEYEEAVEWIEDEFEDEPCHSDSTIGEEDTQETATEREASDDATTFIPTSTTLPPSPRTSESTPNSETSTSDEPISTQTQPTTNWDESTATTLPTTLSTEDSKTDDTTSSQTQPTTNWDESTATTLPTTLSTEDSKTDDTTSPQTQPTTNWDESTATTLPTTLSTEDYKTDDTTSTQAQSATNFEESTTYVPSSTSTTSEDPTTTSRNYSDEDLIQASCNAEPNRAFMIPHPSDCTKYAICRSGVYIIGQCTNNTHFSPVYKSCRSPDVAGCTINN